MHPYLQLIRFDKPVGTLLLMFPCWWGVLAYSDHVPMAILALFALGSFAMRSAGCVVNDMADRHIDVKVTRTATRPLAAGTVSMKEAYLILVILLCVALCVALALGWEIVVLGACWLPLVVAYPFMKRITFWPQAFLGMTFGAGPLFGMVAVTGDIYAGGLWLYAASIFWVLGYDTIYACQDMKDDARIGVRSTALLFGNKVNWWVGGFYGATVICFLISTIISQNSGSDAAFLMMIVLLSVQINMLNAHNEALCLRLFKLNIWVGLAGCVAV